MTLKKTWDTIKELIKKKPHRSQLPTSFLCNNKYINNPKEIANNFNEFFSNIGPNLAKQFDKNSNDFKKYLNTNYVNSVFITEIKTSEVLEIMRQLKPNKSHGYDEIHPRVIKEIAPQISTVLCHIFNLTFKTGIIPKGLKISLITPIFKAGSNEEFNNYRPISVRLMNYIEKNHILHNNQYGFRRNRSNTMAIIHLTEKIKRTIENNEFTIGIFLDLSKAFDTVNHNIRLQKLESYGTRGILRKWFQSYLTDREQIVKYNK
ncbi:Hypothetical predicted protein, partial [Paramuricea clavata]